MSVGYSTGNVKFDTQAMDHLLKAPDGAVGAHLGRIGLQIVTLAKRLTGSQTGRLSKSIQSKQVRVAAGQELRVFSNLKYAYMVHEGTRPHIIDPAGHRFMAFNEHGHRVYAQVVHHPGTRGKHYLTIPLRQVVH